MKIPEKPQLIDALQILVTASRNTNSKDELRMRSAVELERIRQKALNHAECLLGALESMPPDSLTVVGGDLIVSRAGKWSPPL